MDGALVRFEIRSRKARSGRALQEREGERLREQERKKEKNERHLGERARSCAMDGALVRALKIRSRKARSGRALQRERQRKRNYERKRERERQQGEPARSCALDGALWRNLKYAPERRGRSALCREKDREREI